MIHAYNVFIKEDVYGKWIHRTASCGRLQHPLLWGGSLSHNRLVPQTIKSKPALLNHSALSNATMAWDLEAPHGTTWFKKIAKVDESIWKAGLSYAAARLCPAKTIIWLQERKIHQTESHYLPKGSGDQPHIYWYWLGSWLITHFHLVCQCSRCSIDQTMGPTSCQMTACGCSVVCWLWYNDHKAGGPKSKLFMTALLTINQRLVYI